LADKIGRTDIIGHLLYCKVQIPISADIQMVKYQWEYSHWVSHHYFNDFELHSSNNASVWNAHN